jgi:hypothetical protein
MIGPTFGANDNSKLQKRLNTIYDFLRVRKDVHGFSNLVREGAELAFGNQEIVVGVNEEQSSVGAGLFRVSHAVSP